MKFTKFGKAVLMSALSAGVILSVTSCIQSYTVGYLYITGTATAQSSSNGIISGFKIDHNTGKLTAINGLPVASGGANPVRAVLTTASRFLYVLNKGVPASSGAECTTATPCSNSNITLFAVGANGILTAEETFTTQGYNPFRMIADSSGNYLYVLDHDSPDNYNQSSADGCALALAGVQTCGDITAFQINQTTGRLSLITNQQVTAAGGAPLNYFPVPANPIDFAMSTGYILTLSGTPTAGDSVFPYTYSATNGQLTVNQNSAQPLTYGGNANGLVDNATAIVIGGGNVYVLDNEPPNPNPTSAQSQILPFTVGSGGALQAVNGGVISEDPTLSNPIYLVTESKGKFLYVANQGDTAPNTTTPYAFSGIGGYVINTSSSPQLSPTEPATFGSGSGPQCIVEDPSGQFFYTANFGDSTVTGRLVDPNAGTLNDLRVASTYTLNGPATWCLVDGRTN
jgi:6-phosphogluconolactonase (cycloisomerase 2 family)